MAQPPYDPYDLGLRPLDDPNDDDPYGLGLRPIQSKEKSWYEDILTVPTALRTIPAVGGSLLGSAFGPVGTLAGGAAGGGLGEAAAEWYESGRLNPWLIGTEAALNTIPFVGETPGAGAGLKAIGKHALSSAVQGGFQGAVGSVPRHIAQTGNWEFPSPEEATSQTIGGTLFGGVTGLAHGAGNVGWQNYKEGLPKPYVGNPPEFGRTPPEVYGPEIGPYGLGEGQADLPFKPHIDAATFARMRDAQTPPPPPTDASGQGLLFGNEVPPPPEPPTPPPPVVNQNQQVVTIPNPDAATVAFYRSQGYVSIPGMRSPEGHVQMVRGDVAPLYVTAQKNKTVPPPEPVSREVPGPMGEGQVGGDTVHVPNENVTTQFVENMKAGGYVLTDKTATHSTFKQIGESHDMFGGGEPPDQVGPTVPEEEIIGPDVEMNQWPPESGNWMPPVNQPDVEAQPGLPFGPQRVTPTERQNVVLGMEIPPPPPDTLQQNLPFNPPPSNRPMMDPRMAARVEAGGPREFDFTQSPSEQGQLFPMELRGQSQLDRIGDQIHQQVADANAYDEHAQSLLRPDEPVQQNMIPDFQDAEISAYLRGEDATPPEMRDIGISEMSRPPSELEQGELFPQEPEPYYPGPEYAPVDEAAQRAINERRGLSIVDQATKGGLTSEEAEFARRFGIPKPGEQVTKRPPPEPMPEQLELPGTSLKEHADALGISTEGKSAEDIANAIQRQSSTISEMTGVPPDDFIRMEVGERIAILRNMQGQYAEHGARVANKELLQNAIDATPTGGKVSVNIDFQGTNPSITVVDDGPGLNLDLLKNEYVTLTGSGKRGVGAASGRKSIGEMGVGKATYLLGTDSFEITTVAREADGSKWKYEIKGTPDNMIGEDAHGNPVNPVKINKTRMPDSESTGTIVKVFDKEKANLEAARRYLETFAEYSDTPVEVSLKTNQYLSPAMSQIYDLNKTVSPRTAGVGQLVHSGSAPGGDFSLSIPPSAVWKDDATSIVAVLTSRGMFQGSETIYPGGVGRIPDRVVVNIEPTVSASDAKNYPLTSPTRERMKGPFNNVVRQAIKDHIMTAAEAKQRADLAAAFNALQPVPNPRNSNQQLSFVTNDRGGRYTPQELDKFNGNPRIQAIAGEIKKMLDRFNSLFPVQKTRTIKYGFDLADIGKGGVNIPNQSNTAENAILIGFFDSLNDAGGDPQVAGEMLAHTILHELNHNLVREEGAGFTYQFRKTDAKFGSQERANVAETIRKLLTSSSGGYDPGILELIQDHSNARGRQDTTIDFIARQAKGSVIEKPGQGRPSSSSGYSGEGITPSEISIQGVKQATGWGQGATKGGKQNPNEFNFIREALAVPSAATTTMDLSAPGRQGLSQILTPQFWKAAGAMFKGISPEGFNQIDAELRSKPIFQRKVDLKTGKVGKSFADEIGMKLFNPASKAGPRAEATASRWLETGGNIPGISTAYRNTLGVPVRASNRAYITFLNHLNANRTEFLLNKARDMSVEALNTGKARQGMMPWKQKFTPAEAMDLNPYHNLVLGKEIADFVNTATGHGPLKTHLLPFKQAEVNLESAAGVLNHVLFSPGLLASRIRMLNPSTYIMASPFVRKQYMKAAVSTAAAWFASSQLMKMAAGPDAEINDDFTSADFGKVRIGNTRMDPGGGFLQFLVAYGRMYAGGSTSSSTGTYHRFGSGYQAQTQESTMQRFFVNKLNPVTKFAYDLGTASEYNPFHVGDRTMQMFVPLAVQDIIELAKEDPHMLPWIIPVLFGMGTQSYEKGESVGKMIPPEKDWLVTGGGLRDLMPWNFNEEAPPSYWR